MTIKELYPAKRPQILLEPRAARRLDPRFNYTRNSTATYVDREGILQTAARGEPRFEFNFETKEFEGLLIERASSNELYNSETIGGTGWTKRVGIAGANSLIADLNNIEAPDGTMTATRFTSNDSGTGTWFEASHSTMSDTQKSVSIFVKAGTVSKFAIKERNNEYWAAIDIANKTLEDRIAGRPPTYTRANFIELANGWIRVLFLGRIGSTSGPDFAINPVGNGTIYFWGAQIENGPVHNSYIATNGSAVSKAADLLSIETPLPASGSVFIDTRTLAAEEDDTILALKNDNDEQITLSYQSNADTLNSLTTIASYQGNAQTTLPLLVPTPSRSRHLITYGINNYQHQESASRYAASLSTSVPSNLNQLSIGHDAVDLTKAFNGYINTIYVWDGEVLPAVAETLMHQQLNTINADIEQSVPSGVLAMIINTQGTELTGNRNFTLPARDPNNQNEFAVNWGDNSESSHTGTNAADITHTYRVAGIYLIWAEGRIENLFFNERPSAREVLEIVSWGTGEMYTSPPTMGNTFRGCTEMNFSTRAKTENIPDTSAAVSWIYAFYDCSSITGAFPAFNFSSATNFEKAWQNCSSIESFPNAGDQTQNVTNFRDAWRNCRSLTSFPLINTSSAESYLGTWRDCQGLTSFPLLNSSSVTDFGYAWRDCTNLTSFPAINTSSGTNFLHAWHDCDSLQSFPLLNFSSATNISVAWRTCRALTSFPTLNTSNVTQFSWAWSNCSGLTSFPAIDTSNGNNFDSAWNGCTSLTSFPSLNFSEANTFDQTWRNCSSLTTFPSGRFNSTSATNFDEAWEDCALTAASIENILVSINAAGTSDGDLGLEGGTNAARSTWTNAATSAYNALIARGWLITDNT